MRRRIAETVGLLFFMMAAVLAEAEQWPNWRGPRRDGTSLNFHGTVTA